MKSFKSAVFTAFAALFLAVSLSGCLGDEKTASQSSENGSSLFESGKVKLVLKPGSSLIMMKFSERSVAEKRTGVIRSMLQDHGVIVEEINMSRDSPGTVFFVIKMEKSHGDVSLSFEKNNLESFVVKAYFGEELAWWDSSYGDEAKYVG